MFSYFINKTMSGTVATLHPFYFIFFFYFFFYFFFLPLIFYESLEDFLDVHFFSNHILFSICNFFISFLLLFSWDWSTFDFFLIFDTLYSIEFYSAPFKSIQFSIVFCSYLFNSIEFQSAHRDDNLNMNSFIFILTS